MAQRNLLDAIVDIASLRIASIQSDSESKNQVQQQGQSFEEFCKDLLAGVRSFETRDEVLAEQFSYLGSANNPPDAMFRGGNFGDAFEFKKSGSPKKENQLNSSYPTSRLVVNNSRLTSQARNCESWQSRDFFYCFGDRPDFSKLGNWLWIVQGNLIAEDVTALTALEEKLRSAISLVIKEAGYEAASTKELGRINALDSISSSSLRIRPMWLLKGPETVFGSLEGVQQNKNSRFVVHVLLTLDKWNSLVASSRTWDQFPGDFNDAGVSIKNLGNSEHNSIQVTNPSNTSSNAPKIAVVLIRIEIC